MDGARVSKMLAALGAAVGRDMVTGGQEDLHHLLSKLFILRLQNT